MAHLLLEFWKQKDHELKASLGYKVSPKQALETVVSPKRRKRRKERKRCRKSVWGVGVGKKIRTVNERV